MRAALALVCALLAAGPALAGEAGSAADLPGMFARDIRPLLDTYCYGCHNADKMKGEIDLAKDDTAKAITRQRKTWISALQQLRDGEMPPAKAMKKPTDDERKRMAAFIERAIDDLDCGESRDPGKPALRRLNRSEYNNSISALFGMELSPAGNFSPDGLSYGFDVIADSLTLSPVQVEQYYEAAGKVLDAAARNPKAMALVHVARPGAGVSERDAARAVIERFATRAYRRPVDAAHVEKLMALFDAGRKANKPYALALRPMLAAVLISPRFLIRIEDQDGTQSGPYPVSAYDLASRLSYFLWSAPPDDELMKLAASNELLKPEVIEQQARRMLSDPRSRALAGNFAGQWLRLRELEAHKPDAKRFPAFTPSLRKAMAEEAERFIGELIARDRPVTELLDANHTFLNQELAAHYGIEGVTGPEMRRVLLKDRRRGGVLTMAAILTVTSDPERTNIPRRGNYVAGALLGTPPPRPPANVPALEDAKKEAGAAKKTLRELLELHRQNPECASCHTKIDPLGFGLENFDAIGRWQDQQDGLPIDASGVLPGGETFTGPVALKAILMARKQAFARSMAEMLLTYALGRGLQHDDECVVREAVAALEKNGYRFSALAATIVRSFPFTHRRNPSL